VSARARRGNSDLLIYSPYAWEPFTTRYRHTPRKVLFQFHPHPGMERRILLEDAAKHPAVRHSFEEEVGEGVSNELRQRRYDSWKHADLILCASSFTRKSLIEAGAEPSRCKVIPYGIDVADPSSGSAASEQFTVLFVGTGSQRKGLHHLLLAWKKAVLPKDSRLILVCRFIDTAIATMAKTMPNVHLIYGVGGSQLNELFSNSTLFAMPSLVEGFGQVYLEALAHGCPVLGTPNTGLSDLCDDNGPIWQVEPGQIDQLVSALESLSRALPGDISIRQRAQACATRWSWERFRSSIRSALECPDDLK
jgi:glycosyltransferase involved in cell wall biosynthesis